MTDPLTRDYLWVRVEGLLNSLGIVGPNIFHRIATPEDNEKEDPEVVALTSDDDWCVCGRIWPCEAWQLGGLIREAEQEARAAGVRAPADQLPSLPEHEDRTDCWCEPTVGWPGHPLGLVHRVPARADTATLVEALKRMVDETYQTHYTPSNESGPEEWDYSLYEPSIEAVEQAIRALVALDTAALLEAARAVVDHAFEENR